MIAPVENLRLERIEKFLSARGWTRERESARAVRYRAPNDLLLSEAFYLSLPVRADDSEGQIVLGRVVKTLADLYSISPVQLQEIFSEADTVVSVQFIDPETELGSIPFVRFEGFTEKMKKVLLDLASFVVTGLPTVKNHTWEAEEFLKHCRFLQTEQGSYVAKIQMPAERLLKEPTLFEPDGIPSSMVVERLAQVLDFVVGPVFKRDEEIYSDEFWLESTGVLNVDVLAGIGELLKKSVTQQVSFGFGTLEEIRTVRSGPVRDVELSFLDNYVAYLRERVEDVVDIDVRGKIVKLHSRNPTKNRNYIAVAAVFEGKSVMVGVTLRSADYGIAVMAHRQNQLVHIRGRAQRLKTEYSIIALELLEPV